MPSPDYIRDLRTLIGDAPVNLMSAAGLIFDAQGRVLLQRLVGRTDVWSLPGGLCELAEPPEQTLRREVHEETGLEVLEAELQDISSQESKDEASLAKVKKQLRDLEAKVKDQEEELDEQAGTIQMLEQVWQCRGLTPVVN